MSSVGDLACITCPLPFSCDSDFGKDILQAQENYNTTFLFTLQIVLYEKLSYARCFRVAHFELHRFINLVIEKTPYG